MTDPAILPIRAYLRMHAGCCVTADKARGVVLTLRDTGGLFPDGITVQWLGQAAAEFYDRHQGELIPGRCLDLEIFHLRGVQNELRARVKTCQLAPLAPSWIKHFEKSNPSLQEPQQP